MKPRYSSNSGIFERRGDPWVSEKEGVREYGRDLFSENPDFDRYFTERHPEADRSAFARASADLRKGLAEIREGAAPEKVSPPSKQRKIACRVREMQHALNRMGRGND
jgi:hypothetical protein